MGISKPRTYFSLRKRAGSGAASAARIRSLGASHSGLEAGEKAGWEYLNSLGSRTVRDFQRVRCVTITAGAEGAADPAATVMTVPDLCDSIRFGSSMPKAYIPVLIFAVLAAAFPALTLLIFQLIRPSSGAVGAKLKPYECGIPAESDSRGRYSVRFYIVAILFVIFDVETVFLFPWAVDYRMLGLYGLVSMFVFLGILIVGYVWLYRKGALEWL